MLFFPKPTKKPKRKTKRIAAKGRFVEWGKNTTKTYRRKRTDFQVLAKANEYRAARRMDMPRAQQAFNEILDSMGVLFEAEAIFLNGDSFVLIDVLCRKERIAWEIDGPQHEEKGYSRHDAERDAWLLRRYGIRTIRISNKMVFTEPEMVREIVTGILEIVDI